MKKNVLIVSTFYSQHIQGYLEAIEKTKSTNLFVLLPIHSTSKENLRSVSSVASLYEFKKINISNQLILLKILNKIVNFIYQLIQFLKLPIKFDTVEIHYPTLSVIPFILGAKFKAQRLGLCFWGDDLQLMSRAFGIFMHLSRTMYDYIVSGNIHFIEIIKNKFKIPWNRLHFICFGSSVLERMQNVKVNKEDLKHKLKLPTDSIVITCGYNNSTRQNHHEIIDACEIVSSKLNNLHFIFPMSYPKNEEYTRKIENRLRSSSLNYTIYKNYLHDDENIELKYVNDILIHIQESDGFSAAMAEYIYAGSVVINGKWLEYSQFVNKGGFHLTTTKEDLYINLEKAILNLTNYTNLCTANRRIIWELKSWEHNINRWIQIY